MYRYKHRRWVYLWSINKPFSPICCKRICNIQRVRIFYIKNTEAHRGLYNKPRWPKPFMSNKRFWA